MKIIIKQKIKEMKRQIYASSLLLATIITILGCNRIGKPINFDYGRIENNKYINDYFDLELTVPDKWVAQSKEQMERQAQKGRDLIAGDNVNTKALLMVSEIKTANLLSVYQFEKGTAVDLNPNITLVAENLNDYPGMKKGSDYLFQARKLLSQSQFKYDYLDQDFKEEKIEGIDFYLMNASIKSMGIEINQTYYSAVLNGFSFNIIITYNNAQQKQDLLNIIHSLKFR
jgi:hypothetical protein